MRAPTLFKAAGVVLGLVLVLGLAGLFSLSHAPGRALVSHLVDGRRINAVGVVQLTGLHGDVLSAFTVERLTLSDAQGVWLEAESVQVDWRVRSLLSHSILINAIEADRIVVHRRPDLEGGSSGGAASRGLRLNRLVLSQLVLDTPVLGGRMELQAHAQLSTHAEDGQSLSAEIVRLDGASDRLVADLTRSPQGVIVGRLSAQAEADSPLSSLVYAHGRGFALQADIHGTPEAGDADYSFAVGDTVGLEGRGHWDKDAWRLEGVTNAEAWPDLPADLRTLLSGGEISGAGALDPLTGGLTFTSAAGEFTLRKAETPLITLTAQLAENALSVVLPGSVSVQALRLEAQLDRSDPQNWLSGDMQAQGVAHSQITTELVSARFVVGIEADALAFDVTGDARAVRWANARAGEALGDQVRFSAIGAYDQALQEIRLAAVDVQAEGVVASGAGDLALSPLAFQGRFSVGLDDAGRVQDGLSGPVAIEGVGDVNGIVLTLSAENLVADGAPFKLATGLTGQGRIDLRNGLTVSDLAVEGRYMRLSGDIAMSGDEPVWQGAIDYAIDAEALGVDGLSGVVVGAVELEQGERRLSARVQAQADILSLGDAALEQPVLRIELAPSGSGFAGDWRFDARSDEARVQLHGDVAWADNTGRVGLQSGRYADIIVQGQARLSPQALALDFTAAQDGAIDLWSASLDYQASRTDMLAGELDLSAALENYSHSGLTVNTATVRVFGPVENLAFELNAEGGTTEPFTLNVSGPVAYQQGRAEAVLDVAGEFAGRRLTSPGPLSLAYQEGELSAEARLALDEAGIRINVRRDPQTTTLAYDLSALPADLVMQGLSLPQADGVLHLEGAFSRRNALWTGRSRLIVSDLSSATTQGPHALNGSIGLIVQPEETRLDGAFTGGDLEIELDLTLPGAVSGFDRLTHPDWRGDLSVNGDVAVLAGLYLPEGEALRGMLSVNALIEGGDTSGEVRFSEGALDSALAGRSFEPIIAQGGWRTGALVIESLSIGDGEKSGANAQAEFRMTQDGVEGEGRIELNQLYLVDRPELSGGASGYADFSLRDRVLTVTGEADVQRLDVRPTSSGNGSSIPLIEVVELNRPEILERAYRRPIRIELDYHLRADERLFVSSRAFSSEWSADVHVTGSADRPNLAGQANLISGQASLLTVPFDLTLGRVSFDGPVSQSQLALEARHETSDLVVIGRVDGSVRTPEVSFESTPSLPEDEILSRLLFGSGVTDLSPLQASQLAAQLSGAGWLDAMAGVRSVLGMDRLNVRQNGDGAVTFLGGRQLSEDVYLELETGVGQALGAARIEWRLTPSVVLASEVSGDSSNEISLSWRRSFD